MFKTFIAALPGLWGRFTAHHQMHASEHVGVFAGSLLPIGDWRHD